MNNSPPLNELRRIPSVKLIEQKKGTCYAHAIARSLVRLLQTLAVLPENDTIAEIQFEFLFYKLFFIIITKKFQCDGAGTVETIKYLLQYLISHIDDNHTDENIYKILNDSGGNRSIIECTDETCSSEDTSVEYEPILNILSTEVKTKVKTKFETRLKAILPKLLIIQEDYTVQESENTPSPLIIDTLNKGLQPIIRINVSNKNQYGNLATDIGDCLPNGGHALILKQWRKSCVVIKNTWSVNDIDIEPNKFNEVHTEEGKSSELQDTCEYLRVYGHTTLTDINQLSCIDDSTKKKTDLYFYILTYDEDIFTLIDSEHKTDIDSNKVKLTVNTDYTVPTPFKQRTNYLVVLNPLIDDELRNYSDRIADLLIKNKAINYLYYCYHTYNKPSEITQTSHIQNYLKTNKFFPNIDDYNNFQETDEFNYSALHYIIESLIRDTELFEKFFDFIKDIAADREKLTNVFSFLTPLISSTYSKQEEISRNPHIPFTYSGSIKTRISDYFSRLKNIKDNFFYKLIPKQNRILSLWSGGKKTRHRFNKTKNKRNTRKNLFYK